MAAEAFELMLALHRAPTLGARLRARALQGWVLDVIRIAADDERMIDDAQTVTGLSATQLRDAATLYLTQVLFCDGADSYRTLGVSADADPRRIKEHHRWLMHWLHPDRQRGGEWSVFADSVNRAWNDLRTPARRAAYDAWRASEMPTGAVAMPDVVPLVAAAAPDAGPGPLLSGRAVQRLPQRVLGVIAGIAVLMVAGLVALHDVDEPGASTLPESAPAIAANLIAELAAAGSAPAPTPVEPLPAAAARVADADGVAAASRGVAAPADGRTEPTAASSSPPQPAPERSAPIGADASRAPARSAPASPDMRVPRAPPAVPTPATASASRAVSTVVQQAPPAADVEPSPDALPSPAADVVSEGVAVAQAAVPSAAGPALAQAQATLARMQQAYRDGDLDLLTSLFTDEPGGRSRAALAREYRDLFARSSARTLELHDLVWLAAPDTLVGLGRFEAGVTPRRGGSSRTTRGAVRVELRLQHGEARIVSISHEGNES